MLLRAPDPAGRAYWVSRLNTGTFNESILGLFGGSSEYYSSLQKGRGTDPTFIAALYQDLLQRSPAPNEVAYWMGRLASGTPQTEMANLFAHSHEYHLDLVKSWYQHYLGRSADPDGAEFWAEYLDHENRDDAGIVSVAASDEYFAKALTY